MTGIGTSTGFHRERTTNSEKGRIEMASQTTILAMDAKWDDSWDTFIELLPNFCPRDSASFHSSTVTAIKKAKPAAAERSPDGTEQQQQHLQEQLPGQLPPPDTAHDHDDTLAV
jgi:hypothetical protein